MEIARRHDARRLLLAVAAAILVHVGLFFGIPFLTSLDTAPLPDYGPIVVTLEEPAAALEPPPPPPLPTPEPKPAVSAAPAPKPAPAAPSPKPAPAATASSVAAPPKTVVDPGAAPAPRRAPGTSAFRQAGETTGASAGSAAASIVAGPPPVILPSPGTSRTIGSGEQRSGVAVSSNPSAHAAGSTGSLEMSKVDAALSKPATAGSAGAAAGSGGSGSATGGSTAGTARGAPVEWEDQSAAKGREYVTLPRAVLPEWARKSGLLPEVRIAFSVNAEGLVTSARVAQTSGYADVDNACLDAMRKARFTAARGAPDIRGVQRFTLELVR